MARRAASYEPPGPTPKPLGQRDAQPSLRDMIPQKKAGRRPMTNQDTFSLREAAEALGLASSTVRRHIRAGRLRATYVAGPFGRELRLGHGDLAASVGLREAAGFAWDRQARPVEAVTLGELLRWAEQPVVRAASLAWARTALTVTAGRSSMGPGAALGVRET